MGETNYREYLKGPEVRVKKYFYVLRPLLAAKLIIDKHSVPPMLFEKLVEAELEDDLKPELDKLLALKKSMQEMGMAPKRQIFNDYIERVMPKIEEIAESIENEQVERDMLNELFLHMIK